ncbi:MULTISPECIES: hypothetical protein [Brucella/Ochrobactrum group]|uniref:Uncharacterized protein n=1 Tax=Ochrobactrum soli TaxID=2448455 RepID=A0A2P9HI47_9HYPH|nr:MULTISPECIES: hypothetical protein [Brucella]MCI0999035.1 hypothetical protein [Ochrobactrum sp. C6C9]RRD21892.1 hypothetical protein ECB98_22595 [Brucellaceae bacterium VT-16-1752]WHT43859.1 hypothetical protein QLQ11_12780 [Ochrobactrum sp. SSR]MDX4076435.1 hypothetical protein [Brucella sp. NBRC 113783]RLL73286.1 hypothetical protein D8666_15995 [[Ochrobactrum] soli]
MKFHHFLLGAALLAAFPKVAMAEDAANNRLHAAWDALAKGEGEFLSTKQFASLNNLAYQAAIVRLCDGHELDHEAFRRKIEDVIKDTDKKLSDEQADLREAAVLVAFGARFGLFLAEGSDDSKPEFCASADEIKSSQDISVLAK